MYTLAQIAEMQNDPVVRGVVETIADSPLFDALPFQTTTSSAIQYRRTATLGNAEFRAINEGYDESTPTFTTHTVPLKIIGGDSHVDRFLVRTDGNNVEDLVATTMRAKAKAVQALFVDTLINGDGTDDSFEGIDAFVTAEDNQIDSPEDGFGTTADSRQDMFDALDQLLASVVGGPSALIMSDTMLGRFKSAARREGILTDAQSFGRTIQTYGDVPLVSAGRTPAGAQIIGTNDIYAVRFDTESGVHGVMVDPLEAYTVGEMQTKPSILVRVDWYATVAMKHPDAAAVLRFTNDEA